MTSVQNISAAQPLKKGNSAKTPWGAVGGASTGFGFFVGTQIAYMPFSKTLFKNIANFTPQEQEAILTEANRMVEESKIASKGFKGIKITDTSDILFYLSNGLDMSTFHGHKKEVPDLKFVDKNKIKPEDAYQEIIEGLKNARKNGTIKEKFIINLSSITKPFRKASEYLIGLVINDKKNVLSSLEIGCYDSIGNKIYTSKFASLLHEVGHAINKNKNTLTKTPLFLSLISKYLLIPAVILNAMLTKKTQENNENKKTINKLRDFTHKNIGFTIAALSTPLLLEEGLASYRAIKFANESKILTDKVKNQHNKLLKMTYGSYLIGTAIIASTAKVAVVIKDKIVKRKNKHNKP